MTSNRDIINALQALRSKSECGARSKAQTNTAREALLLRIGAEDVSRPVYTVSDFAEYYTYQFRHVILRPAMVGFAVLMLAAGGWMTSVNAAYESVPGDMLYPIKIANEQAQLSITISDQKRATLHMEFATRRLAEVTTINQSDSSNKSDRLKTAVAAFKNEVAEAKTSMQNLAGTSSAAEVASALDAKATEYASVIDQAAQTLDIASEAGVDVAAAKADVEQAGNDAVEVLVTTAETSPEQETVAVDLQKSFQQNLADIDSRVKLTLGRIAVLEHVAVTGMARLPSGTDLSAMAVKLQRMSTDTNKASNVFASGGYRSAFEQLSALEQTIDEVGEQIAVLELSVIAQQDTTVELSPID